MKKISIIIIFLFLCILSLKSQEDAVKEIRNIYNNYQKIIEGTDDGIYQLKFKVSTIQIEGGIGPVEINNDYYYDESTYTDEPEGEDNFKYKSVLRKVEVKEETVSYSKYVEYCFDKKGNLIFYFVRYTGYSCGEERYYFKNEKLIKATSKPITSEKCHLLDESDKYKKFTHYKAQFTKDDLFREKMISNNAKTHIIAFKNLYILARY
jgi:hypothetical protein